MENRRRSFIQIINEYKLIVFLLILLFGIHIFWAITWPLLNDETYYWDWGRDLQLSYIDAPPAVSWISWLSEKFLSGKLGARILIPVLYICTIILSIKSANLLACYSTNQYTSLNSTKINRALIVIILFTAIPIFHMFSIVLSPDAPLFFALTGTLYFALKSIENINNRKSNRLSLKSGFFLGVFLGIGILSKYLGEPVALAIFLGLVFIRGVKNTFQSDKIFWCITILTALCVSSPVIIWNLQNNFASLRFQGQHGFLGWHADLKLFLLYLLTVSLVLLPWYSYLFFKQIFHSISRKDFLKSANSIPIWIFSMIFIFISCAALGKGKGALTHWITPGFLVLIPLLAAHWQKLTYRHPTYWNYINIFSVSVSIIVFSVILTDPFHNFIAHHPTKLAASIQKIQKRLYERNLSFSSIENLEGKIKAHFLQTAPFNQTYIKNITQTKCTQEPYLASFNWMWASQLAFHFKDHPRVFAFQHNLRTTYYNWRDSFTSLTGCRFFIVGPKSLYNQDQINDILNINSKHEFIVKKRYSHDETEMIIIEGTLKNTENLQNLDKEKTRKIKFY